MSKVQTRDPFIQSNNKALTLENDIKKFYRGEL